MEKNQIDIVRVKLIADKSLYSDVKIETIEDILRYALKNGLDSLLDLPGFGALGLAQLKFQLEKHKIIDKTGHSDLYQYIIREADNQ